MPTYDYKCPECGNEEEIFLTMNKEAKIYCSKCNSEMKKLINAVPIHYKCSGFYTTDYKDKK